MLADDVPCSRADLARLLDVHPKTLRRWLDDDTAPRVASLAVFWLTRWGASAADADAHNSAVTAAVQARLLRDELISAQRQVARLRRALDVAALDTANSPVFREA